MIPLLLSAALLWALLRLFGTLETEHGFLRMLVIATGLFVAANVFRELPPPLAIPAVSVMLALTLWKWCRLPPGRAAVVTVIFTGCQVAMEYFLLP